MTIIIVYNNSVNSYKKQEIAMNCFREDIHPEELKRIVIIGSYPCYHKRDTRTTAPLRTAKAAYEVMRERNAVNFQPKNTTIQIYDLTSGKLEGTYTYEELLHA